MIEAVYNWLGQPASLLTVLLFAGSVYVALWWIGRPESPAEPTGLLAWVWEPLPEPALATGPPTAAEDDEPDTVELEVVTTRTFRLGDEDLTFNFRSAA